MVRHNLTTAGVLAEISSFQAYLNSSEIGQPLMWTLHNPLPPFQIGWSCASSIGRCVGVDHSLGNETVHQDSACSGECKPLADNEWLAYSPNWLTVAPGVIKATSDTILKKSIANGEILPPTEVLSAPTNFRCTLVTPVLFGSYYLCAVDQL